MCNEERRVPSKAQSTPYNSDYRVWVLVTMPKRLVATQTRVLPASLTTSLPLQRPHERGVPHECDTKWIYISQPEVPVRGLEGTGVPLGTPLFTGKIRFWTLVW